MGNYKRNSQGRFVKGTPQPNGFKKGCTPANKGKRYKCSQYNLSEEGRIQKIKNLYKNGISPLLGKPHSEEWNSKIGKGSRGKKRTEDFKKVISSTLKKKGITPPEKFWFIKGMKKNSDEKIEIGRRVKELWKQPNYRKKVLGKREKSSLEIKMERLLRQNNLPYKFVGNGKFSIGNKVPDFVNCNGKKIAIEVYYRKHKEEFRGGLDSWKIGRTKIFSEFGWKLEFFDETMVNNNEVVKRLGVD